MGMFLDPFTPKNFHSLLHLLASFYIPHHPPKKTAAQISSTQQLRSILLGAVILGPSQSASLVLLALSLTTSLFPPSVLIPVGCLQHALRPVRVWITQMSQPKKGIAFQTFRLLNYKNTFLKTNCSIMRNVGDHHKIILILKIYVHFSLQHYENSFR